MRRPLYRFAMIPRSANVPVVPLPEHRPPVCPSPAASSPATDPSTSRPAAPDPVPTTPPEPPRARPAWPGVTLAILALTGAIVLARSFLMPVILAFLLAVTFTPIRRFLGRRGVPPVVTSALIVLTLFVGIGVAVMALSGPIRDYADEMPTIMRDMEIKLRGISEAVKKVSEASEELSNAASGAADAANGDAETVVVASGPGLMSSLAVTAPAILAQALFTLVLLFFLVASGDMFYRKIVQSSATFQDKKRSMEIVRDIERKLSQYFLTVTVINACLGVAIGLTLWWIGMPNPALFGVAAFLLNFIPFLGAIVGIVLTVMIGIVSFDTVGQAFLAGGLYLFWTTLEGNFITPYAVGRSLKLNTVIVFIAVAFWGWAWSVIGMFVAVPLLITVRVFAENIPGLGGVALFLGGEEAPPPVEDDKARAAVAQAPKA